MDSTSSWINWFGGPRIRWEMLSILFCFFGRAFKHREDWDRVLSLPEQQGRDRTSTAEKMAECADICLNMCGDGGTNDIVVCALKNLWKLKSNILSDNSDGLLRGTGIVVGAFTTTFLHRLPCSAEVTPLSEYRSTLASSLYYLDKCSSLFTGRPPLLNRHYCHCPMPLDLSEDELYSGPKALAAATAKLDLNGWNGGNKIHATTWWRALCLLGPIIEKILELSLGVNAEFTKTTIHDLNAQIDDVVASYPPQIQYHSVQHWSQSLSNGRHRQELYIVARIQLDILRCQFLVQRLNVSRFHDAGQALLDIAQEMMAVVLSVWLNRDYLQNYNCVLNWIAVCYGIPCAGLLCVELLRSTTPTTADSPPPLRFSRSEVIQSLTIYVAFLGWIRPTDGNAELCWKLKNVIKRIVDNVLDSSAPAPQPRLDQSMSDLVEDRNDATEEAMMEIGDWDDLNWLNTIDWTQGDWLDMNQPLMQ